MSLIFIRLTNMTMFCKRETSFNISSTFIRVFL